MTGFRALRALRALEALTLMHLVWLVFGTLAAIRVGVELGGLWHGVRDLTPR